MNRPIVADRPGIGRLDAAGIREAVLAQLRYSFGKDPGAATLGDWRLALSRVVRDMVVDPWFETTRRVYRERRKRVYYLSMEFLIGRLLQDAVLNLGLEEAAREAITSLGVDYEAVLADEPDAALGNGGLGRLAACFLDSMSTVGVATFGYGIRYAHGLFRQSFVDGWQAEEAEDWLRLTHVWEFERHEACYPIGFGGHATAVGWVPAETVLAEAYDTPVPGWGGTWVNTLRLWKASPTMEFDLSAFNRGDFLGAASPAVLTETISRVLYPDDTTPQGKELRLKQEYFFTAASLADIVRRFLNHEKDLRLLPRRVAIQLNDTHPAIAVPELVRLLTDQHGLTFEEAWEVTQGCLHYTNHTLLPEALERWSTGLMGEVLPRHLGIIERIDEAHAKATKRPDGLRIIDHGEVRMGTLAFVGSRRVNGVSALHTELMKETVFRDLHRLHPDRIVNETNGVTPRRWLHGCNPALSALITETVGGGWVTQLDRLEGLAERAEDADFRDRFMAAKAANKRRLVEWLATSHDVVVDPAALFDVQVKRIHEYKRQLLNILETIALWNAMKRDPGAGWVPRVKIFGGKAAPGYAMAKLVIKLINDVGKLVNADPVTRDLLRVVYPPNYNVSMAERLIPAADLSEQISTAGMEASGTGNMKFAMNGALTIGTLDGANVEIRDRVGEDRIFIFGLTAAEVAARRAEGYSPGEAIEADPRLAEAVAQVADGQFSPGEPHRFQGLVDNLRHHDWFLVAADFTAYWDAQRQVERFWREPDAWARAAVHNTANMGYFSSDRTIRGYAREVWQAEMSG
ncbi:MAG TPA: glycogen/starch/alpha-glucan phosphorylase [Paracoccaceae bacterium]|nr:glycogen/starch/alpha-glucan phosphorylase [Paracoccaceae bacterium]